MGEEWVRLTPESRDPLQTMIHYRRAGGHWSHRLYWGGAGEEPEPGTDGDHSLSTSELIAIPPFAILLEAAERVVTNADVGQRRSVYLVSHDDLMALQAALATLEADDG